MHKVSNLKNVNLIMVYIYHTDILKCRQKIKHQTITVDSQVKKKTRIIGNMFNMILFRLKKN